MDLDDEELRATRKLNGVDKESSIEEDIKMMYHIIEFYKRLDTMHGNDKCKEIKAVENILSEREADKKRIKELEEENYLQRKQIMSAYDKGWIPVQKIKDKIEEIEKEYNEIISEYGNIDTDVIINVPDKNVRKYLDELVIKILVLQELLEDK